MSREEHLSYKFEYGKELLNSGRIAVNEWLLLTTAWSP